MCENEYDDDDDDLDVNTEKYIFHFISHIICQDILINLDTSKWE